MIRSSSFVAWCWLLGIAASGCKSSYVARVSERTGQVDRDYGAAEGRWEPAPTGAELALGHALRTGPSARALVALRTGARLRIEADTLVRFAASAPEEGEAVDVEFGAVLLEVEQEPFLLRSALGPMRVAPGTRLQIGAADRIIRYEVKVGTAVFERGPSPVGLEAGQRVTIDIATATFIDLNEARQAPTRETRAEDADRSAMPASADWLPAPPPAQAPPTPDIAERRTIRELGAEAREPKQVDLSLPAGESAIVHDPSPPTAIELRVRPPCTREPRVRLGARPPFTLTDGRTATTVLLPRGRHDYLLTCRADGNREERLRGTLYVLQDKGTARLPRTPPTTFVDTDGRRYTLLYQNLLPEVRVKWPTAPRATRYQLTVSSTGARPRHIDTAKPEHLFPAGQLSEGDHVLRFATADAAHSAPDTTLRIRFDNAAPAAVVHRPESGTFRAGQTIEISGVALPGWTVTVLDQLLPLDEQSRFRTELTLPRDTRSLAIRFENRERGVHYYLRRTRADR